MQYCVMCDDVTNCTEDCKHCIEESEELEKDKCEEEM